MDQFGLGDIFDELGIPKEYETSNPQQLSFMGYLKLVDWKEPWLVALLTFHLVLFFLIMKLRNILAVQSVLGLLMLSIVYMSETLNELAAEHWRYFSNHQYFDTKGFFISTILSAPLLLNCLVIIVNFLMQNYYILRDIQQLKVRKVQQSSTSAGDTSKRKQCSPDKKPDTSVGNKKSD
ncbi:transmembrane protein 18-like [Watersipora subatra]|uniref:transmembrane protein 18-like n=1 Tax=Watersipora subatra TaxID=2589382 RepID=UPI00355B31FD